MLNQKTKEKIIRDSISLESYGIDDLAWTKEAAKNLLQAIMKDRIGIFGGDVYKLTNSHLEPLCDNWACEPSDTESEMDYYSRSKSESLKYIENYPTQKEEKILFSITFTENILLDNE